MSADIRPLSPTRACRVLSSSVAHALLDSEKTRDSERGTLVHAIMFGEKHAVVNIDADNYRTKAAQLARDEARAAGKVPLLRDEEDAFNVAVEKLAPQIQRYGYVEHHKRIEWIADGCPHRGELDAFDTGGSIVGNPRAVGPYWIGDLKTVKGGKARAAATGGAIVAARHHVQMAAYREGIASVYGLDPRCIGVRLHFAEVEPPFGVVTAILSPMMLALGHREWCRARRLWLKAYEEEDFRPYANDDAHEVDPPQWALAEAEARDQAMASDDEPF